MRRGCFDKQVARQGVAGLGYVAAVLHVCQVPHGRGDPDVRKECGRGWEPLCRLDRRWDGQRRCLCLRFLLQRRAHLHLPPCPAPASAASRQRPIAGHLRLNRRRADSIRRGGHAKPSQANGAFASRNPPHPASAVVSSGPAPRCHPARRDHRTRGGAPAVSVQGETCRPRRQAPRVPAAERPAAGYPAGGHADRDPHAAAVRFLPSRISRRRARARARTGARHQAPAQDLRLAPWRPRIFSL